MRSKVEKEDSKQQFREAEKKAYLASLEEYKSKKSLAEQFAEARKVPKEERENWAVVFSENLAVAMGYRMNAGTSLAFITNPDTGDFYIAETADFGLGVGTPSIGYGPSIAVFPNAKKPKDLEGWITTGGLSGAVLKKISMGVEGHFYDKGLIGGRIVGTWENSNFTKSINMKEILGKDLLRFEGHGSKDFSKVVGSQSLKREDMNKYIELRGKETELNFKNIQGAFRYLKDNGNTFRKSETLNQLFDRVNRIRESQEGY